MRRREFLASASSASGVLALSTLPSFAQEKDIVRRVAILWGGAKDSHDSVALVQSLINRLPSYGWSVGKNIALEIRWGDNDPLQVQAAARELLEMKPSVCVAGPTSALLPLMRLTSEVPIIFVSVSDPLGRRVVDSLSRPSGNVTGFSYRDYSIFGKWVALSQAIVPTLQEIGLLLLGTTPVAREWVEAATAASVAAGCRFKFLPVHQDADILAALTEFSSAKDRAVVVPGDTFLERVNIRPLVIKAANELKLPIVYGDREFCEKGGLLAYDSDHEEQFTRVAEYVARILRGEAISALPDQNTSKYRLVINTSCARAIGITIPNSLLALADEVIE